MTSHREMLRAIREGRLRAGQDLKDAKPRPTMVFPGPGDPVPWIESVAYVKDQTHLADAQVFSLVVSPANRLLYIEAVLTSESAANSMMAMAIESRLQAKWKYFNPGSKPSEICEPTAILEGPRNAQAFNRKLEIPSFRGYAHHVAILDQSGEMILAKNESELWMKLRAKLTCPTLPSWGVDLAGRLDGGIVTRCDSFGLPDGLTPYFLAENANTLFDQMVAEYVNVHGLKE